MLNICQSGTMSRFALPRQKKKRMATSIRQPSSGDFSILGMYCRKIDPWKGALFKLIQQILQLRSQSMPIAKIAQECGLTVGQVKYLLAKEKLSAIPPNDSDTRQRDLLPREDAPLKRDMLLNLYSPTVLQVSWELAWTRLVMVASYLRAEQEEVQKVVRLYDVTGIMFTGSNAHSWVDIPITGEANDCFIPNVQPNRSYIADFGLFHQNRFCPILRSEAVSTPGSHAPAWTRHFRPDDREAFSQMTRGK